MGSETRLGLGAVLTMTAQQFIAELDKAGRSVTRLRTGLRNLVIGSRMATQSLHHAGASIRTAMGIGAGAALLAIKRFSDFERSITEVGTAGGIFGSQFAAMKPEIMDLAFSLGREVPVALSEIGKTLPELARAGVAIKDLGKAAKPALQVSLIDTSITAAETVKYTTRILASFGKEVSEFTGVAEKMAWAASQAPITFRDLAEAMKYVAPTARRFGESFETTLAALTELGRSGLAGTIGGTALGRMLEQLGKRTSIKAQDELSIGDKIFSKTGFKGMRNYIAVVNDALDESNLDAREKLGIFNRLAESRGARALQVLKDIGIGTIEELESRMVQAEGFLQNANDLMATDMKGTLQLMTNALDEVSFRFIQVFQEDIQASIRGFTTTLGDAAEAFQILGSSMSEPEKAAKLAELSDKGIAMAEGLREAVKLIGEGFDWLKGKLGDFGVTLDTKTITKVVALGVAFMGLSVVLLPLMMPLLMIVQTVGNLVGIVAGSTMALWGLGGALKGLAGLLPAVLRGLGGMGTAAAVAGGTAGAGALAGGIGGVLGVLTGPVGLIAIAGAAALSNDGFRESVKKLASGFWDLTKKIGSSLLEALGKLKPAMEVAFSPLAGYTELLGEATVQLGELWGELDRWNKQWTAKNKPWDLTWKGFLEKRKEWFHIGLSGEAKAENRASRAEKTEAERQQLERQRLGPYVFPGPAIGIRASRRKARALEAAEAGSSEVVDNRWALQPPINISAESKIDFCGRYPSAAVGHYQAELDERGGAKITHWQRSKLLMHSAIPATRGAA